MKHNILLYISLATTMLWSCSTDNIQESDNNLHGVSLSSSIVSFEGEQQTKVNLAGNGFEDGDMIRIKVICPYVASQEAGESTYGGTYDGFWVQKWSSGSGWTSILDRDGFDFNGDYQRSGGSSIIGQVLSQQTPYVFTASTWTEEKVFKIGGKMVVQYANVFHADQSNPANYKASDVLWAQNFMQTATDMIHFDFHHVMAALRITVNDIELTDKAVLTIENMPDIDQDEIIVGDRFAAKSMVNSAFGYKEKHKCSAEENGKALGIGVNSNMASSTTKFEQISQTATYKAMRKENTNKVYQLIVPPCKIKNPVVWIRDGESRWKVALGETTFNAGYMYNITLNLQSQTE